MQAGIGLENRRLANGLALGIGVPSPSLAPATSFDLEARAQGEAGDNNPALSWTYDRMMNQDGG